MRKNIFNMFLEKTLSLPLWIKQVLYLKLAKEMQSKFCENFLRTQKDNIFSTFIPTLTFMGKTELAERKCGLDSNIYNFLQACADGQSMLEISVNTFLSMEEVAKYYELCLEQSFIKKPESVEIYAMAGFISGKFRTGEYFKQKGQITVDQLQQALIAQKEAEKSNNPKYFGEILAELGFVKQEDLKALLVLKEEAKKRFILDTTTIPKPEMIHADDKAMYEEEIKKLKEDNAKLRKKLFALLELVKNNV